MLDLANVLIEGVAVSGIGSAISLPSLGVGLDIGVCPEFAISNQTICITHGHIDHLGAAAQHAAIRDMRCVAPSRFVVPPHLVAPLQAMFDLWARVQGSFNYEIIPLGIGDELKLNKDLVVRPFSTDHTLPSQGYGFWRTKQKLKAKYHGLSGQEIGKLRQQGVKISDTVESCEIAYTGDTRIEVTEQHVVRQAKVLIMEMTFIADEITTEFARERGHIHIREFAERADVFENEAILVCHFSARYGDDQIAQAITGLPQCLHSRVTPLPVG